MLRSQERVLLLIVAYVVFQLSVYALLFGLFYISVPYNYPVRYNPDANPTEREAAAWFPVPIR